MGFTLRADAPPIREDESGALRVGNTRVLLELVIHAFQDGATPETIVRQYDTLELKDVYAVISYYLQHRDDVEAYLTQREEAAEQVRRRVEATPQPNLAQIRDRVNRARGG